MTRIVRGHTNIKRVHAKNFIQEAAQKRLTETVASFNKQTHNSLTVDAIEVDYYQIQDRTGVPCTCEKTEVMPQFAEIPESNVPPVIPTQKKDSSSGIQINLKNNDLFGDSNAERIMDALVVDVSGYSKEAEKAINKEPEGNVDYENGLFLGANVQCGICYRAGYQPGYKAYGKQRHVLTNHDIENLYDYLVDSTQSPHKIIKQTESKNAFVEFKVSVPKYFSSLTFSLRNNTEILKGARIYSTNGEVLTIYHFRESAGKHLGIRVKDKEFTHLVIEFDPGNPKLLVNIGVESQTLDYTMLETIGNLPAVLPPSIHEVKSNDILICKKRRLALKVIDKERKITSDQRRLEWVVQTRVLQPTEAIKFIADGFKLI